MMWAPNGDFFVGYLKKDGRKSHGWIAYADGRMYIGHWKSGLKDAM